MAAKTMPFLSNHSCENLCREIHDSWGHLNPYLVQELATLKQIECRKIRETYMKIYGEDLYEYFKNAAKKVQIDDNMQGVFSVSSNTCTALSMKMLNPHERDAMVAKESLEQNDVNFKALVEIYTCRKSSHVLLIQEAYQAKFKRHLDQDIIKIEPPNPYQKILMALSASHKAHNVDISQDIAKCDARRLFQAGEGKSGAIDQPLVLEILSKRSIPQLKLTFSSYKHIYGHSFTSSLKKRICGEFEDALQVVVKCIASPSKHYAETLHASLKGTTNDKGELDRVMGSRSEVEMHQIQRVFQKKYGVDLNCAISECIPEGDYRNFLLSFAKN